MWGARSIPSTRPRAGGSLTAGFSQSRASSLLALDCEKPAVRLPPALGRVEGMLRAPHIRSHDEDLVDAVEELHRHRRSRAERERGDGEVGHGASLGVELD